MTPIDRDAVADVHHVLAANFYRLAAYGSNRAMAEDAMENVAREIVASLTHRRHMAAPAYAARECSVHKMFGKENDPKCICCDGPHCFAAAFEPTDGMNDHAGRPDLTSWLFRQAYAMPDGIKVRIVVEAVES